MACRIAVLMMIVSAGVAVAGSGRGWPLPPERTGLLYVAGWSSDNVGEYLPDGTFLRTLTAAGMVKPRGVAVDDQGNLVVVCEGNVANPACVLRLDLAGNVLQTITHADLTSGTGLSQAPDGRWFVGNFNPGRIVVFDASWSYLQTITQMGMNGVNCVSFDPGGAFAASAALANLVYRFDSSGAFVGTVSHPNIGSPMSIAMDSAGDHYLSNGGSGVIIKFDAAWNPLFTFGGGTLSSPQGILVDADDGLTITNFSANVLHFYDSQGMLLGSTPLTGVSTGRNGAFQTSPRVLSRLGGVGAGVGFPEAVLTVNGTAGDALGRVALGLTQPWTLAIAAPASGPAPAPYVLWAFAGEPALSNVEVLPYGLGLFSFGTPLLGSPPLTIANSLGGEAILGTGALPAGPAPTTLLSLPGGLGFPLNLTLQGLILDNGAATAPAIPASPTNALVLDIL